MRIQPVYIWAASAATAVVVVAFGWLGSTALANDHCIEIEGRHRETHVKVLLGQCNQDLE